MSSNSAEMMKVEHSLEVRHLIKLLFCMVQLCPRKFHFLANDTVLDKVLSRVHFIVGSFTLTDKKRGRMTEIGSVFARAN